MARPYSRQEEKAGKNTNLFRTSVLFRYTLLQKSQGETIVPRIVDNIVEPLLPALQETLNVAYRADFFVGHCNLRSAAPLARASGNLPCRCWPGASHSTPCRTRGTRG